MAVSIPGLVSIIIFYIIILAVGIWAGRKSKGTTDDAMVAGRSLGLFVGIFTMTATWVGGGYINGTAEVVFTSGYGLVWCQAPFGYAISLVLGGAFFAGKMRSQGYVTMLDPFQQKYGEVMGAILYLPALCGDLFWTAAILSALGSTIAVIMDLDIKISIIVSACIAVIYTLFGGLYSVAYTDVIQLCAIFIGLWLSIPFAFTHKATRPIGETFDKWKGGLTPPDAGGWIDSALLLMFGGLPWQVYFQRVLSAKTARNAQILSFAAAGGCIIMATPAILIGSIAASTDWNQTSFTGDAEANAQMILPLVLRYLCPEAVAFIGLGAVSAAVMSSSDSSVLSSASMFARNVYAPIYNGIRKTKATDRHVIWVMRVAVLFVAAIATAMAITVKSTYGLWYLCSDFVYVILFPQLVSVIHIPFTNTYGSACGFVIGLVFRLLGGEPLLSLTQVIPYPVWFPFKTLTMLISFFIMIIVSGITNLLFKKEILSKEADIFKCVVNTTPVEMTDLKEKPTDNGQPSNGNVGHENPVFSVQNGGDIN